MGWVEKRGKGYRGRVRVGDETLSTPTAPSKEEARSLLRELEVSLDKGTWIDPKAGEVLFKDWVKVWLRTRGTMAVSTRRNDEGRIDTHLLPAFGESQLVEITPMRVREWISDLSAVRAAKTVRHCHALLHGIVDAAVDEGLLRKNPCIGTRLPKSARSEHVRLTEPQLQRLVLAFDEGTPRALVTVLALTGMRWGEGVGLQVKNVDVLKRELHVRTTLTEVGGNLQWKDQPKTRRSYRSISLPAAAIDQLIPLVVGRGSEDLVFQNVDCPGDCYHCQRAAEEERDVRLVHAVRNRIFRAKHWDPARDKAELPKNMTPHQLRHTHVAMLIADGHGLPVIQDRLGHESIQITSDVYGYLMPRLDTAVIETLDRAFGGLGAPTAPTDLGADLGEPTSTEPSEPDGQNSPDASVHGAGER